MKSKTLKYLPVAFFALATTALATKAITENYLSGEHKNEGTPPVIGAWQQIEKLL